MSTLAIPSWPNCKKIKSQFQVLCVKNAYISISVETPFCWDFLHIPNSPFPLLTFLFLWITAGRQDSVWLESSLYRREVETNADNSRNSKSLFLAQCFGLSSDLWWVYSRSACRQFFILKRMSGYFCVFLTSEIQRLHDWKLWSWAPLWSYQTIWK